MGFLQRHSQKLIFLSFIVVSAAAGWGIPWFHEWSGTQQSHRSPLIFRLGIGLLVGGISLCFLLPRLLLPRQTSESNKQPSIRFRFTMRQALVFFALTAIWVGSSRQPEVAASRFLCIGMLCYAGWLMRHNRAERWALVALFSCMFLPWLWMAADRSLLQVLEIPAMILGRGLPAFVPQLLVGVLIDQRTVGWFWMGTLLTAIQMRLGLWMIQHGPGRAIAVLVYSLLASLFGSFFLYEGLRA